MPRFSCVKSSETTRACSELEHSIGCDKYDVEVFGSSTERCVCNDADLCNGVEAVMTSSCGHVIMVTTLLINVLIGHLL